MTDTTLTADQVHAHVHDLRAQSVQPPEKIELGRTQIAALEAQNREAAGISDIGPLTQFQGLPVVKSRRDDHVKLLAAGESGEDVEVTFVQPIAPSGPDAPAVEAEAEAEQSG